MWENEPRPLPPIAEEAFELLTEQLDEDGFSWEQAFELLEEDREFVEADAEYAIQRLLLRGYLYEVDNALYVTPVDD